MATHGAAEPRETRNPSSLGGMRLRIVCVVPEYAPHVSGSEVYAQGVCEALARRGHDVRLVCGSSDSAPFTGDSERIGGVSVWRGIGARRSIHAAVRRCMLRLGSSPEKVLANRKALEYEARLWAAAPDVVLALPVPRQSVVGAARFAKRSDCPAIVVPFYHLALDGFAEDPSAWLGLLSSFNVVIASTAAEQSFLETRGISPSRLRRPGMFVHRLPSPTPEAMRAFRDRLGVGSGFLIVGAAAGFSEPKGSLAVARAAAALPHLTFAFFGGAPPRASLEKRVRLGSNVHLLGFVSEREKAVALAAADLFALPSRADSFGIVYQEAHSLGTPSLALDLPVMREVIGPAGFYVDPAEGDDGIVRMLAELAQRPDRLRPAAAAAPGVAARYAPDPALSRICELVEEVSARAGGAAGG